MWVILSSIYFSAHGLSQLSEHLLIFLSGSVSLWRMPTKLFWQLVPQDIWKKVHTPKHSQKSQKEAIHLQTCKAFLFSLHCFNMSVITFINWFDIYSNISYIGKERDNLFHVYPTLILGFMVCLTVLLQTPKP